MRKFWQQHRFLIIIVLLAALLRAWAAWQLPVDFDEPVYLQAGFDYARAIRSGDVNAVIDYPENREHPPLVKLLYGLAILGLGDHASWENAIFASRAVSAFFGVLSVWLLALLNPLAGAFLAVQTLVVKYTSQAYLEALPLFGTIAAIVSLYWSKSIRDARFWVSALALGLTAAGKYSYFPILFVLVYLYFWEKKFPWTGLFPYLGVAALTFWALNPALWHDPINRLVESITFHAAYSQSAHVQHSGYPWYQPFLWVSRSYAYLWHPDVFLYFGFDGLIAIFAIIGLRWTWLKDRWVVIWMAIGMIFLLLWPTKWPQYALVVLPAFCLAGAVGVKELYARIHEADLYWNWIGSMIQRPSRGWIIAGILILSLVTLGQMANTVQRAMSKRGWWNFTTTNALVPSNTIYSILASPEREMILAGEAGVVSLRLSEDTGLPETWDQFTPQNSGLPSNRVLAMAQDGSNALWFGTPSGLSRYAGEKWQTFRAQDFGLPGEQVQAIEAGSGGRLWIGTDAGLAVYDGSTWKHYTTTNSGLMDDFILSLAVEPQPAGDVIWIGLRNGISRLDTATGKWTDFTAGSMGIGGGGVSDLMVDSRGRLWAATLGSGLNLWDGKNWSAYRVSNSDIPSNTVQKIIETEPGVYWVATAIPTGVGGVLAEFNGQNWRVFTSENSGFSGGEPLALVLDWDGRLWIGTRTAGVDIYQVK